MTLTPVHRYYDFLKCSIVILLPLLQIKNQLVLKDKMTGNNSLKSVNTSTANPNGKPQLGDKTLGIEPQICFYEIEDGGKTEQREQEEILVVHNLSVAAFKKNVLKVGSLGSINLIMGDPPLSA